MHVVWDGKTDLLLRNVRVPTTIRNIRVAGKLPYLRKRTGMLARRRTLEEFVRATLARRRDNSRFP